MKMINYYLKFVIISTSENYLSKDRVVIRKEKGSYGYCNCKTLGVLVERKEFDPNQEFIDISDTNSYQLRPKALYFGKDNGMYYKDKDKGITYLTYAEQINATNFLEKYKDYVEENYGKV